MVGIDLTGQGALVTGASRGIGRATALLLARAGAQVALVARNEESLRALAAEIASAGGKAVVHPCDVTNAGAVADVVGKVVEAFGSLDILVNNAGITRDNLLIRMKDEEWAEVLDTNLRSVFLFTRAAVRPMMKQRRGSIVNVTSVVGIRGNAGQANYASSKAGIVGFTKSVAQELATRNIRVNAVAPGFIETDMTRELTEAQRKEILGSIPAGRMGQADDVAAAVLYLASPFAAYVTGEVLRVDGGMAM